MTRRIRVSVTHVEAFRRYLRPPAYLDESRQPTAESVLADLLGESPMGEPALVGRALHEVLEKPGDCLSGFAQFKETSGEEFPGGGKELPEDEIDFLNAAGYSFAAKNFRSLGLFDWYESQRYGAVLELKGQLDIDHLRHPIRLVGVLDWAMGLVIADHKVSRRAHDPAEKEASCQWKLYLRMFAAERFIYNLIQLAYKPKGRNFEVVKAVDTLELWRPADLDEQTDDLLEQFLYFLEQHDALDYDLRRRRR